QALPNSRSKSEAAPDGSLSCGSAVRQPANPSVIHRRRTRLVDCAHAIAARPPPADELSSWLDRPLHPSRVGAPGATRPTRDVSFISYPSPYRSIWETVSAF